MEHDPKYRERVYKIVRRIPRGRVMTYGQLAEILGEGYTPRTVGFVMHGSNDKTPWHRVVNAQGACSTVKVVLPHDKQQRMLEAEGVSLINGVVAIWKPTSGFHPPSEAAEGHQPSRPYSNAKFSQGEI